MKRVVYKGGSQGEHGFTEATELKKGQIYEVVSEEIELEETFYILKGVDGKFNSKWFYEILSTPIYLAFSSQIPVEGERYMCIRMNSDKQGNIHRDVCKTSKVLKVHPINTDTYEIVTKNSIYVVKIIRYDQ